MTKALKSKPASATEQRDELLRKKDHAYKIYADTAHSRQVAEGHADSLARQLRDQSLEDDDAQLAAEHAEAGAEAEQYGAKASAALDRVKAYEAELESLYGRAFAELAEEANDASARARVALADALVGIRRASDMWDAAVQAWAPLCRSARIQGVPPFPIAPHLLAGLDDDELAQPPGVEIYEPIAEGEAIVVAGK